MTKDVLKLIIDTKMMLSLNREFIILYACIISLLNIVIYKLSNSKR